MYQQHLAASQGQVTEWTPILHPVQNDEAKGNKSSNALSLQAQIKSVNPTSKPFYN